MSNVRDFFTEMGVRAEQRMNELGGEMKTLDARRTKLEAVEAELDKLMEDGKLTEKECDQLMKEVRGAGLDPGALMGLIIELRGKDGVISGDNARRFENEAGDALKKARHGVEGQLYDVQQEASLEEHLSGVGYGTAGDYNKKMHEIGMTLIRNLAC
jgi:hypothetical protein